MQLIMCAFCGGKLLMSSTEYIEKQGNFIIVIKNVPCEQCAQCGETYFSDAVVKRLENILNGIKFIASEITVTVIDYEAKAA